MMKLGALFVLGGLFRLALAQNTNLDGSYLPGVAPGAPAGSYALSGFENVNLFNGNLNFSLPLLEVGGRGEAKYTIHLTQERNGRFASSPTTK